MKATHGTRVLLSVFLLLSFVAVARGATLQAKVTEVQSGNAIVVSNINRPLKVRLKGIAPPEAGQPFSDAAREHLKALVMDKAVFVEYTDLSGGYLEAKVLLNGVDIGAQMLRDGVAWYDHSVNYGLSDPDRNLYAQCEEVARNEKRGLWREQNPVAPWQYRRAQLAKLENIPGESTMPAPVPKTRPAKSSSLSNDDLLGSVLGGAPAAGGLGLTPIFKSGTADAWLKFYSPQDHFSVVLPGNAVEASYTGADENGPGSFHIVVGGNRNGLYMAMRGKGGLLRDADSDLTDRAVKTFIGGMNDHATAHGEFDRILQVKPGRVVRLNKIFGKQYTLESQAFSGSVRVFTRRLNNEQEIFMVFAVTVPGSEVLATRFINSFTIK